MRDYKFRGRRIDNGEWVYGCLTRYSGFMSYITVDLIENEVHKVDTKTVGEYTGLTDKNGVEIYEGDIVNVPYNHIGVHVVKFDNGQYNTASYKVSKCVVIGNIHQNPELLADGSV